MVKRRTQQTEPFVMLPRSLLESPAWRGLGINARRLLDFLMLEHIKHGGRENGHLTAPREQLEAAGVGWRLITGAIAELQQAGLVDVARGRGRAPSRYALTWLPLAGGFEPTNRWRLIAAGPAPSDGGEIGDSGFVAVHEGEHQMFTKVNNKARRCSPW